MRKNSILLNGNWIMDFLGVEEYTSEAEPSLDKAVSVSAAVPAYWEDILDKFRASNIHTKLSYNPLYTLQRYPQVGYVPDMALPNVHGCFVYSRTFSVDEDLSNGELELYVGGAHNTLDAWINGAYIGKHRGYSSEFTLSVPRETLKVGENRITLTVSNLRQEGYKERPVSGCTARAANECTGGIYGDVMLRVAVGGLRDVWVSTAADLSTFTVKSADILLADAAVTVTDHKGNTVRTGVIAKGCDSVSFDASDLSLWSPDSPYRYTVTVSLEGKCVVRKFGIRRLVSEGTMLRLNGEPFMFRAICEHGYYPVTVHPPRDKSYYRAVIRRLKELGFNAIRFHTWVPMAEYMEAADELGVLIEVETPNNTTYREWCDIVLYTRRYTSVVMYSSGNEMIIDEDYIEHLRACAELVHTKSDSLMSPMSAMRGVEYFSYGDCQVEEPFTHNPKRLAALSEFCDAYNSYSLGLTSYNSASGDRRLPESSLYRPLPGLGGVFAGL